MAFTVILASCKKYDNDFKDLRAQIAALATQVAGVNTLVAGLSSTTASLTAITTALTANSAQNTAIAASLAAVTTTINGINTTLGTVASGQLSQTALINTLINTVNANQVATAALVNKVTADLTAITNGQTVTLNAATQAQINAAIAALNVSIAAGTSTNAQNILAAQANLNAAITANTASVNANTTAAVAAAQAALTAAVSASTAANAAAITAAQTALQTAIANLQSNVNASTQAAVTAAQANLNAALTAQTTTLQGNITAAQTALTTLLNTAIAGSSANSTAIAGVASQLATSVANLQAAITAAQVAAASDNSTQTAALQLTIAALQAALNTANANIQNILSTTDIVNGPLSITNQAELTAALVLGSKVKIITGLLTINTTNFTTAMMDSLKQVTNGTQASPKTAWIGSVGGAVSVTGTNAATAVDLSKLTTIGGAASFSGAAHNLSTLTGVNGSYSVTGTDISDDALVSIGALNTLTLSYHGAYSYPALTTAARIVATRLGYLTPTTPGTTGINFPVIGTSTIFSDGANPDNTLGYLHVKSVVINRSATLALLVVDSATTVTYGELTHTGAGLGISAIRATSVDLSKLATVTGALNVSTAAAGTVNLTALVGNPTAGTPSSVTVTGPTTLTMPAYTALSASHTLNSTTVTTAVLNANQGTATFAGLTALTTITVGNLKVALNDSRFAASNLLVSVTVNASDLVNASVAFASTALRNTASVSVSTSGLLSSLSLQNVARLVSVTTAGQMDGFLVNLCGNGGSWAPATTTLTLGHTANTTGSGVGTSVTVTNNSRVRSLTTTTDRMKALTVTGNDSLTTVNFASYTTNITGGAVAMAVFGNSAGVSGLVGTYTPSIFATNTAPVIVQSGLSTLKAYASALLASGAHAGSTIDFGFTTTTGLVQARMDADAATFNAAGGYTNPSAFSFVQRVGDAGGDLGSRINVARELAFLQ